MFCYSMCSKDVSGVLPACWPAGFPADSTATINVVATRQRRCYNTMKSHSAHRNRGCVTVSRLLNQSYRVLRVTMDNASGHEDAAACATSKMRSAPVRNGEAHR